MVSSFAGYLFSYTEERNIELTSNDAVPLYSENPYLATKNLSSQVTCDGNYFINITVALIDIDGSSGDYLLIHSGEFEIIKGRSMCSSVQIFICVSK